MANLIPKNHTTDIESVIESKINELAALLTEQGSQFFILAQSPNNGNDFGICYNVDCETPESFIGFMSHLAAGVEDVSGDLCSIEIVKKNKE